MKFDHVFWTYRQVARGCQLNSLVGFEDDFEIGLGTPVLHYFPDDVTVAMDPVFDKDTITPDNLRGVVRLVSGRMSEHLRGKNLQNVEYLPVSVLNHRGRPVQPQYEIIHPIHPIDCLDYTACGITYCDPDDEEFIQEMKSFVLDIDKCGNFPPLFRIERMAEHVLIHRGLAKELDDAGFTGNGWIEPSDIGDVWLAGPLPIHLLDA